MYILFQNVMRISLFIIPVIIVLLLLFPRLGRRYAPEWRSLIWLLVTVRLLIPFSISLPAFFQNNTTTPMGNNPNALLEIMTALSPNTDAVNVAAEPIANPSVSIRVLLAVVWIAGMVLFFSWNIIAYHIVVRRLQRWRIPITDSVSLAVFHEVKQRYSITGNIGLYQSPKTKTPLLLGFFTPCIYLPNKNFSTTELTNVLSHELCHYKRKDIWFKLTLLLANTIHWFNPVVYMMLRQAELDMEMACDSAILRGAAFEECKEYGLTILSFAEQSKGISSPLTTSFYGGHKQMKLRFAGIINRNKKKSGVALTILCILLIAVCGCSVNQSSVAASSPIDKAAIESKWAFASLELRKSLETPAFVNADMLYYVESVNGTELEAYTIYRSVDESGEPQPEIMFSDDSDPIRAVTITTDAPVELQYVQQDSAETESKSGSLADIVPGSIISVWGAFSESEDAFIADRIVVWTIKGNVTIPDDHYD